MTPPNLSVNIDKNIAKENSSEKSHYVTTIDFSINKSCSTPNCLHLETPLNFPINNDLNKTKMTSIKHLVAATYQKNVEICVAKYQKTKNSQISWRILER